MSLFRRLFLYLLIGHIIFFGLVVVFVPLWIHDRFVKEYETELKKEARIIYHALYEIFKKGGNVEDVSYLIKSYRAEGINVDIYLPKKDKEELKRIEQLLKGKKSISFIKDKYQVVGYYLLENEEKCIQCHSNLPKGAILGAIKLSSDYKKKIDTVKTYLILGIVFYSIFLFFLIFFVSVIQERKIKKAIQLVQDEIDKVNRFSEIILTEDLFRRIESDIKEFDEIFKAWHKFLNKVKNLAVDREILELEIKLLEKVVITSEFIRDWKSYLIELLKQINEVVKIEVFFVLFFIEKEVYDAEVFWFKSPSEEYKKEIENFISKEVKQKLGFTSINFAHTVIYSEPFKTEKKLSFKTKSLILDSPQIGGITGVGYSYFDLLPTQELAFEAILTSFLNVIGSIKAMNKYVKEIEYYATRDSLTDLYNQRIFWELLTYEVERASRYNYKFALILIDLDNFKIINDTFGHEVGDKFLKSIADILKNHVRKGDIIARYGGDEFAIILPMCDLSQAYSMAERIAKKISSFYILGEGGKRASTTISIGIAIYPDHGTSARELFLVADFLLLKGKKEGKNIILFPSSEDIEEIKMRVSEINLLIKQAVNEDKIIPYFQPIVEVKTRNIIGYEVLMRLEIDNEILPAYKFIAYAEEMGLIHKMDLMLIEKAIAKAREKNFSGKLFFNLSPKSIVIKDFVKELASIVKRYSLSPENILFEITERESVRNLELVKRFLNTLRAYGFHFCIDDFGSGFSSYQYIKHFAVDIVKIEGEFILGLKSSSKIDKAIIESIVTFCKRLNIKTIAEFVEDEEILNKLKKLDVDYAQGYLLGKPSPDLI